MHTVSLDQPASGGCPSKFAKMQRSKSLGRQHNGLGQGQGASPTIVLVCSRHSQTHHSETQFDLVNPNLRFRQV
eukprot:6185055-Pleurochrysis_carterae.AAC.2